MEGKSFPKSLRVDGLILASQTFLRCTYCFLPQRTKMAVVKTRKVRARLPVQILNLAREVVVVVVDGDLAP